LHDWVSYVPIRGSSADQCDLWISVEYEEVGPYTGPGAVPYDTEISYWTVLEYIHCPIQWNYDDPDWGTPDIFLDGGGSGSGNNNIIPISHPNTPCERNPIKNLEIAPQTYSKEKGARFGEDARKQFNEDRTALINQAHYGLDMKNNFGDAVFSMFDGTIIETGIDEKGWGKWIRVKSIVNGETIIVLYAHLHAYGGTSDTLEAGTIIGQAGETGNLANAKRQNYAIQHLHIEIREGTNWDTATKKNPEEYVKTKFDSNGEVIESTKC
jgi:murein DD-endopeptidase MepM/ murein hydrolase activator NlpD